MKPLSRTQIDAHAKKYYRCNKCKRYHRKPKWMKRQERWRDQFGYEMQILKEGSAKDGHSDYRLIKEGDAYAIYYRTLANPDWRVFRHYPNLTVALTHYDDLMNMEMRVL